MSDLKTYLASKYMSGPKADAILARSTDPSVKKKRKKPKNEDYIGGSSRQGESSGSAGLMFRDEDEWARNGGDDMDLDGEDAPVVGKALATFQKSASAWSTVGSTSLALPSRSATADTPLDTDEPLEAAPPPPKMTKRKGGLRTAKELKEEADRLAAETRSPSPEPAAGDRPDPTATVHRDATGRVLDVKAMQEEERRKEEEERRKKKEKEEWTKGLVQRREREEMKREEQRMGASEFARTADDRAMNREMQEVERWNDPAAEFLTKKKKKGPRRPVYQGAFPPNRFGVRPGYRWDGVDRSNGFEKKYFQYQNAAARKTYEHNQWSVEDM